MYILSNNTNVTIYIGVTGDIKKRVYQHKEIMTKGFTSKYHVNKSVYYEVCDDPLVAIMREKQLKSYSRSRKNKLVSASNPLWNDLYADL